MIETNPIFIPAPNYNNSATNTGDKIPNQSFEMGVLID